MEVEQDESAAGGGTAHEKMDKMYRYQRYFYDATRKYYLLGRDNLIEDMSVKPGERVLEIGCGTGRNLAILAKRFPETDFYGLDASAEMLENAHSKVSKGGLKNVVLKTALADDFGSKTTFGLDQQFDTVFFSYSISMIPTWRESVSNALANLKQGHKLYIVDFYDQRDLPDWFAGLLQSWLKQFHVVYPAGLIPHLERLAEDGAGRLDVRPVFRSYSFIAAFEKT